jgi:hypothetical protein
MHRLIIILNLPPPLVGGGQEEEGNILKQPAVKYDMKPRLASAAAPPLE